MDIKNYTRIEIINTNSCYYGEKGYVSKSIDVKGETFYLKGTRAHYLENQWERKARVIWISTPPLF